MMLYYFIEKLQVKFNPKKKKKIRITREGKEQQKRFDLGENLISQKKH